MALTGGTLFLCFPAVKSTNMVGLLVEQLHHTAKAVGVNVFTNKDVRKGPRNLILDALPVQCDQGLSLSTPGAGVRCEYLCSCVHLCSEVINLKAGAYSVQQHHCVCLSDGGGTVHSEPQ